MKKILFMVFLVSGSVASNAITVNQEIVTSCGEVYQIHEIGDNVSAEQLEQFKEYMDWVYCG